MIIRKSDREVETMARAEPPETVIVASGVSCRQQIRHGTGRRAWHPVELIRAVAELS